MKSVKSAKLPLEKACLNYEKKKLLILNYTWQNHKNGSSSFEKLHFVFDGAPVLVSPSTPAVSRATLSTSQINAWSCCNCLPIDST